MQHLQKAVEQYLSEIQMHLLFGLEIPSQDIYPTDIQANTQELCVNEKILGAVFMFEKIRNNLYVHQLGTT